MGAFLLQGCQRGASLPNGSFSLTVQNSPSGDRHGGCVLTVRSPDRAVFSLDGKEFSDQIQLPDVHNVNPSEGRFILEWSLVRTTEERQDDFIDLLIRRPNSSGEVSGTTRYRVQKGKMLSSFLTITAVPGVYRVDNTAVPIGRLGDGELTLTAKKVP